MIYYNYYDLLPSSTFPGQHAQLSILQWRNILKEMKDKKITCFAITEKRCSAEVKEFDDFDFMGDAVIFLDKRQTHDLDPYPTHFIQIQKMRLTKVNEMPNSFIFTNHGMTLMGTMDLEKKLADSSKAQTQVQGIIE